MYINTHTYICICIYIYICMITILWEKRERIPLSFQIDSLPQSPWLSFHPTLYFNTIHGPRTLVFPLALLPSCFLRQDAMTLASLWGRAGQKKKVLRKEVFEECPRLRAWEHHVPPHASSPDLSGWLCSARQSHPPLWPRGLQPSRLLCPWHFPGKNAGVGCHFLHRGILLTEGSNCVSYISCIGRFFMTGIAWDCLGC